MGQEADKSTQPGEVLDKKGICMRLGGFVGAVLGFQFGIIVGKPAFFAIGISVGISCGVSVGLAIGTQLDRR